MDPAGKPIHMLTGSYVPPDGDMLLRREEAAATIAEVKSQFNRVAPKLLAAVESKQAAFLKAKGAFDGALRELANAKGDLSAASHEAEVKIAQQESILFETADTEISEWAHAFQDALDELRRYRRIERPARPGQGRVLPWPPSIADPTAATLRAALIYLRDGIVTLGKLKLDAKLDSRKLEGLIGGVSGLDG